MSTNASFPAGRPHLRVVAGDPSDAELAAIAVALAATPTGQAATGGAGRRSRRPAWVAAARLETTGHGQLAAPADLQRGRLLRP